MEQTKILTENRIIMKQAREALVGKWGIAVGAAAIYIVICIIMGSLESVSGLLSLLVSGPLLVGVSLFYLNLSRNRELNVEQVFSGFRTFGRSLAAYLIMVLFTVLWSLLFIIPGIIAAISYSQLFFIMIDDGSIGPRAALKKSKEMRYGRKWKYFCLSWRFFGWGILSILTLGIGFLWLFPYMQVSMAKFYDDVRA